MRSRCTLVLLDFLLEGLVMGSLLGAVHLKEGTFVKHVVKAINLINRPSLVKIIAGPISAGDVKQSPRDSLD